MNQDTRDILPHIPISHWPQTSRIRCTPSVYIEFQDSRILVGDVALFFEHVVHGVEPP